MNSKVSECGNIFWLASYPKSGNTWVRAFIANLQQGANRAIDINQLNTGEIASSREWVESALDFSISELSHDEIDRLRPHIYIWLSKKMRSPQYHKIHDAYIRLPDDQPLVPSAATRGALVIVRNPLDVAVSFAHHYGCSIDTAICNMGDPAFSFAGRLDKQHSQLRQQLLTWSEHIASWMDAEPLSRLVVRYEDMLANGTAEFTKIAQFLELPCTPEKIKKALGYCNFNALKLQEKGTSFREKSCVASQFFRKGVVGDWKSTLTEKQVHTVIADHKEVMMRLGYLNEKGQPVERFDCQWSNSLMDCAV